jgi:hypothetical protein
MNHLTNEREGGGDAVSRWRRRRWYAVMEVVTVEVEAVTVEAEQAVVRAEMEKEKG